jgi:hypothetical protein
MNLFLGRRPHGGGRGALVAASRVLASGSFAGPHVWQGFAVLVPLCVVVLAWATRVFRRAVA